MKTRHAPRTSESSLLVLFVLALAPSARAGGGGPIGARVLEGARAEAARGTPYIMEYAVMKYPGGDVPEGTGVCTDLVVRAFRNAGIDIQKELHEDRVKHPEAYPVNLWEHKRADANIDHRRCPNMAVWFRRTARELGTSIDAGDIPNWKAGDVVFFAAKGEKHPWHTAIISDKRAPDGMPFVIDAFPPKTSETHRLDEFGPIHSHFRTESAPAEPVEKAGSRAVDSSRRR